MPLSAKARIEVYLPDSPTPTYQDLLDELRREFAYTFGGCTLIRALLGSYLSHAGAIVEDRISLLYTDTPLSFEAEAASLTRYAEHLQDTAFHALNEEVVLIAIQAVHHAT